LREVQDKIDNFIDIRGWYEREAVDNTKYIEDINKRICLLIEFAERVARSNDESVATELANDYLDNFWLMSTTDRHSLPEAYLNEYNSYSATDVKNIMSEYTARQQRSSVD
jgi:hypothetical protein